MKSNLLKFADTLEKEKDAYVHEHFIQDPETGAWERSTAAQREYVEWQEYIIERMRNQELESPDFPYKCSDDWQSEIRRVMSDKSICAMNAVGLILDELKMKEPFNSRFHNMLCGAIKVGWGDGIKERLSTAEAERDERQEKLNLYVNLHDEVEKSLTDMTRDRDKVRIELDETNATLGIKIQLFNASTARCEKLEKELTDFKASTTQTCKETLALLDKLL